MANEGGKRERKEWEEDIIGGKEVLTRVRKVELRVRDKRKE